MQLHDQTALYFCGSNLETNMQLSKKVLDEDCSPQYENSDVSQSEAINWFSSTS